MPGPNQVRSWAGRAETMAACWNRLPTKAWLARGLMARTRQAERTPEVKAVPGTAGAVAIGGQSCRKEATRSAATDCRRALE